MNSFATVLEVLAPFQSSISRGPTMHLPTLADTSRKIAEQVDAETVDEIWIRLFLLYRNFAPDRLAVAKRLVHEMRKELGAFYSAK
jgi:hypothetical protein